MGPDLAGASRVLSLRGGALMVRADHPLVAQEIRLRREEILVALERRVGTVAAHLQVVIRPKGEMG